MHDLSGPQLEALARGIGVMMGRPPSDRTSWLGQANVHLSAQHGNVHFLSWHRMYLYWFERILRRAAGDDTLTIPYWDYSVPSQRILPAPLRTPGSSLYIPAPQRSAAVNNGEPPAASVVNMQNAMATIPFMHIGSSGPSFGGSIRVPGPPAQPAQPGRLESSPHNPVHTWVGGGPAGFMGRISVSPQDPLFWLHHANIDRLWEAWLRLGGGRANTSDPVFLNTSFQFFDENGNPVQMTGRQVLDTAGQLGYRYDDQAASQSMSAQGRRAPALLPASRQASKVVGASAPTKPVALTRSPVRVAIPLSKAGNSIGGAGKAAKPRATLTLKGVSGTGAHGVIFNVSARGDGKQANLGPMSLFGSQPGDRHGPGHGSGDMSFDISNVVTAGTKNITVSFEPIDVSGSGGLPGGALATIERLVVTVQGAPKKKQAKKTKKQRAKARRAKKARRQRQKQKQQKQRTSGAPRQRSVNPTQKKPRRTAASQQPTMQAAGANQAAAVPGMKSSPVFGLPGTELEDDAAMDTTHAQH